MKKVDPAQTPRAAAFSLWLHAPMPMLTLFKEFNITNAVKMAKRGGYKLNMLLCWCIGKAASQVPEFQLLPIGGELFSFNSLAVNTVVATKSGDINTCDIPFSENLQQFSQDYLRLTEAVSRTGQAYEAGEDYMVIGTSALPQTQLEGAVNIYAGVFNNPFLIWGKYTKKWWKYSLKISFQFHHVQMDGQQAARFLEILQKELDSLHI